MPALLLAVLLAAAQPPDAGPARGQLVENVASRLDPGQTYTLYIPAPAPEKGGSPVLLVLDPRGRGTVAAEIFREAAKQHGWILISSNQSRSDVQDDRNDRVLRALFPEVQRWGGDPHRIYAAGFSGTAMVSWALGITTGKLAGVIAAGGRLIEELPPRKFSFASFGAAGARDFNNRDMRRIETLLEHEGTRPHRFVEFDGDHQWFGPDVAVEALRWMEIVAMKQGSRASDEALVAAAMRAEADSAAALERAGRRLDALRRYRALVRTFEGLGDVDTARAAIERLRADRSVERELRDEAKWDDFEARYVSDVLARTPVLYAALRQSDGPPALAHLEKGFRLRELTRRAAKPGAEGRAATRMLEALFSQTSYYLTISLFERREYRLAVATLELAAKIHPDRWPVHYNLGAAWARLGDARRSVEALEKAVELGFADAAQLRSDDDFAPMAGDARFQALLARLPSR